MASTVSRGVEQLVLGDLRSFYQHGDYESAAAAGWQLLRADPRNSDVLNLLALSEHRRGNHQAGVVLLRRAIDATPGNYVFWNDLGNILFSQGDRDAAVAAYQQALQLNTSSAETFNNLGALHYKEGDHLTARSLLEQALAIRPKYPDALYNLGNVLAALGKFQKAAARYQQALVLRPEHASTHFNLGITRLLLGDLASGWPDWEWRWRSTQAPFLRNFQQPAWTGEPLEGRRILLYAEQGIGDTLHFLRYLHQVAARGGRVILEVQKPLLALLLDHSDAHQVVAHGEPLPAFDLQCSLMSLGAIFKTTLTSVPPVDSYLPSLGRKPASLCPGRTGVSPLQAGLVWAGNPAHERDSHRSISLDVLAPLFEVEGVVWHSLQHGNAAVQLTKTLRPDVSSASGLDSQIIDQGSNFTSFADTHCAMQQLDIIITVDTSVAHLAGSMGKPVWIMLPCHPDWRWLLKRRDTPWYPSARLFRQTTPGDWISVVHQLRAELQLLVRRHLSG